jgi:hypothetical protein
MPYTQRKINKLEIKLLTSTQRATCICDLIDTRDLLCDYAEDAECNKCKLLFRDEDEKSYMVCVLHDVSLRVSEDIPHVKDR